MKQQASMSQSTQPSTIGLDLGARQGGGCLAPAVFTLFFIAGTMVFYLVFLEPIQYWIESARWPRVPCTISSSHSESAGPGTNAYVPEVRYTYRYAGTVYHSTRVWFIRPGSDTLLQAQAVLNQYPKGLEAYCYVNPRNPTYAVLERGARPALLISLVPAALVLVGLVGLMATARPLLFPGTWRWRWVALAKREARSRPSAPRRVFVPAGPHTFRPRHSGKALRFFVLFAVLCNCLMVFLVREVIDNWREGIPGCYGWSLTFFSIPLVVIGLACLIPPIWGLLRWLNPRPTLTLSSATVELRGHINVRWRFFGSTRRLQRVRLFLEGREEATYTRGTSIHTDSEVFGVINLADTSERAGMRSGQARLTMPGNTVPTFHSEHNGIVWVLRIHGQSQRRPDIDEEFEINVVPAQAQVGKEGNPP